MDSEFWAAIAGAVVGGVISYLLQRQNLEAAEKQRDKEKQDRNDALGNALIFKLIRIHSNLVGFEEHLKERLALAAQFGESDEPWQFYIPFVNLPSPVHFSSDEMGFLLSLKDDDLFNRIASFDEVHNSAIAIFSTLDSQRAVLTSQLPTETMEGEIGHIALTPEQAKYFRPKMVQLNSLIVQASAWCKTEVPNSRFLLIRLKAVLEAKVGIKHKLSFVREADKEATQNSPT